MTRGSLALGAGMFWSLYLIRGATAGAAVATAAVEGDTFGGAAPLFRYPPLSVIHGTLLTTAEEHFGGDDATLATATDWHVQTRIRGGGGSDGGDTLGRLAPYLACTAPENNYRAREALSYLRSIVLSADPDGTTEYTAAVAASAVRVVSSSDEHGVCFLATATPDQADAIARGAAAVGEDGSSEGGSSGGLLAYLMPFPSALKLAPGLLNHAGGGYASAAVGAEHERKAADRTSSSERPHLPSSRRLTTTHGKIVVAPRSNDDATTSVGNGGGRGGGHGGSRGGRSPAHGLIIELAAGVLPANNRQGADGQGPGVDGWDTAYDGGGDLIEEWMAELMSEALSLHETSFWSSGLVEFSSEKGEEGFPRELEGAALLAREWTRAADVVHGLAGGGGSGGPTVGDVCSWDEIVVHHTDNDLLTLRGIDHLLPDGRGAGGNDGEESRELHVACFMGLLSYLASRPEVLRVSAARTMKPLNAAAVANVQSATLAETPMMDAGLDGTGEIIQIVDTGLDYNSCFFIDEDGEEVAHGHYFEEIGVKAGAFSSWYPSFSLTYSMAQIFVGGNFTFDLSRRKIVQYIDLIRQDNGTARSQPYGASWATSGGEAFPWISAGEFSTDDPGGHGTHTAGSAAGATINPTQAETEVCPEGRELSCVGGCIEIDNADGQDDLISSWESFYGFAPFDAVDLDKLCPRYDCDGLPHAYCLGDDEAATLAEHGGVARGAKLAIFDVLDDYFGIGINLAGNGLWAPATEAGAKLHSNSWGGEMGCEYQSFDVLYDDFMYNNPEHLLIYAAGNSGDSGFGFGGGDCTVGSPAVSKSGLAVGASTSGPGRITWTGDDGYATDGTNRAQDIDVMAYFSSYGPTLDGRIKPDVVAPGDVVYSAAGGGTGNYTCRLWNYPGTSMSTPIVAGAAALIRQYFKNETFYAHDVETRGFCDSFGCEAFAPSGATVKAMLINSANLMGGSSEPDGLRGFGRVHLEPGMPLKGESDRALFVADSSDTSTVELTLTEYSFEVDGGAGLDLRATLCWIDPAVSVLSATQLMHDLDLAVYSPAGTRYSMWSSGEVDGVNNVERVIVSEEDLRTEPGMWSVRVWSKRLSASDSQTYSLVVTGAISPPEENGGTVAKVVVTTSSSDSSSSVAAAAEHDGGDDDGDSASDDDQEEGGSSGAARWSSVMPSVGGGGGSAAAASVALFTAAGGAGVVRFAAGLLGLG